MTRNPHELIYFKVYKSQIPVIEQAIETAAMMLGSDKSRGCCLEMICADFLAGANLDSGQPDVLLRCHKFAVRFDTLCSKSPCNTSPKCPRAGVVRGKSLIFAQLPRDT